MTWQSRVCLVRLSEQVAAGLELRADSRRLELYDGQQIKLNTFRRRRTLASALPLQTPQSFARIREKQTIIDDG
ncbi:hypothetical protein FRC03_011592 [Tulasnella sp. 419]|nr:hypothetical protein FRC03_011592 [Tulasnella sp. 419]